MIRLALLASLAALPAAAQDAGVKVTAAWSRATTASATTGAAYLTITAATADRLTGASTPEARTTEVHESRMNGNVMEMRPAGPLDVVPGTPVQLKPGGYHVMLMGLTKPLKPGDHFPLTLTFAKAGAITADVTVGPAGASTPPAGVR